MQQRNQLARLSLDRLLSWNSFSASRSHHDWACPCLVDKDRTIRFRARPISIPRAVEPIEFGIIVGCVAGEIRVPQIGCGVLRVPEMFEEARRHLHARRTQKTRIL